MPIDRATLDRWRGEIAANVGFSLRTAIEAVRHNKLRASLTSLGILFGVASVIAMLAIGKGAEQEILAQMRLLGSNNVMITPLVEQKEEEAKDEPEKQVKKFSPGLTYADAEAIARVIPGVEVTSAEIILNTSMTREGRRRSGKVVGVDTSYFRLTNQSLRRGSWFSPIQVERGLPVAIIGHGVKTRFFTTEEPIGRPIKVGEIWLTVVGVLADRPVASPTASRLGIRDAAMDVYVPARTMLLRFRNRAQLTQRDIEAAAREGDFVRNDAPVESEERRQERTNRNQVDRIIVRVADSRQVPVVAEVAQRMLARRHNSVIDFEITVPELLLRQEQRTKTIFNVVLGAIASISLVVGGIGIMNIMLASVLERIREIGVRRAVGATRREILFQFLSEAVLISVAGGLAGILVGAGLSLGIERLAGIKTIVSGLSVVVAFGVSVATGLAFGIVPAHRAARQDPVVCLRYE
ncbi:MAG: ABC transporter permease [Gemmatimonadales bacterium]|nr:ABC transporter permease [Gemmatimonadota bacterium]MDX2060454.1 ABC transporter permease [Gemmatimonadales bacterium]